MRPSTYIMILLVVALCFSLIGSMVNDFETEYPSVNVSTEWQETYDYSTNINNSMSLTKELLEKVGDEEEGWFTRVASGLAAIPIAVVQAVGVVISTGAYGISIIASIGSEIGIPPIVTSIAAIALIVFLIFALISFLHRFKT